MPSYERVTETGIVSLYYEEEGEGFPILLIAPGGMRSTLSAWQNAPWNPIRQLSENHRVIAMDQRNAGRSTGPITPDDGWHTYTEDQLALMNHLGIGRFNVAGMCIGGSYIGGLLQAAPDRIVSAVVFQTIGLEDNRDAFLEMFNAWADELKPKRPDVKEETWAQFGQNMYGGDKQFFSVTADTFANATCPILVLVGNDLYHPTSASMALAQAAPNSTVIEAWKEEPARKVAIGKVARFVAENSGD
jgi:pimeloyl-ACP methyl ester carboxylesterase